MANENTQIDSNWIPDSEASYHITIVLSNISSHHGVFLNRWSSDWWWQGYTYFTHRFCISVCHLHAFTLHKVLYVPNIKFFIFVSKFCETNNAFIDSYHRFFLWMKFTQGRHFYKIILRMIQRSICSTKSSPLISNVKTTLVRVALSFRYSSRLYLASSRISYRFN